MQLIVQPTAIVQGHESGWFAEIHFIGYTEEGEFELSNGPKARELEATLLYKLAATRSARLTAAEIWDTLPLRLVFFRRREDQPGDEDYWQQWAPYQPERYECLWPNDPMALIEWPAAMLSVRFYYWDESGNQYPVEVVE